MFLVAAFDYLRAEYERVNKKARALRGDGEVMGDIEDIDREILSENLYGVDVNAESVEITKLSLWLKTARLGKELDSLDHTIRIGDSLIEDSNYAYLEHGFNWKSAFPEVFETGGFDVVLGNPPYVRMERIKQMKPYLETRFEVVSDRADLYCYFFERGLRLLKQGGRLGFISSSTFFKTGSGAPLRRYLLKNAAIETVTDFGDLQIFDGVTTYPAILTMRREIPSAEHVLRFRKLDDMPEGNFSADFDENAMAFPQAKLGEGSWELEDAGLRALREKIIGGRKTLKEVYGSPLYGIKTGLNEAFIVNQETRDRLVQEDAKSSELLKPFAVGDDVARWEIEPCDRWIIYTPRGKVDISQYPAIRDYLAIYKPALEKRATRQEWFELQQSQFAFEPSFKNTKILYPDMSQGSKFAMDTTGLYPANTIYGISTDHWAVLAFLNSRIVWFHLLSVSDALRGGQWRIRLFSQNIETIPLANFGDQDTALCELGEACQTAKQQIRNHAIRLQRRIPDLCPPERDTKLNGKLTKWWELEDFAAFRTEVRKLYKADIPLHERSQWEDWFNAEKREIDLLNGEIERHEAEINRIVYYLFDLTPDEIALLEANIR